MARIAEAGDRKVVFGIFIAIFAAGRGGGFPFSTENGGEGSEKNKATERRVRPAGGKARPPDWRRACVTAQPSA